MVVRQPFTLDFNLAKQEDKKRSETKNINVASEYGLFLFDVLTLGYPRLNRISRVIGNPIDFLHTQRIKVHMHSR